MDAGEIAAGDWKPSSFHKDKYGAWAGWPEGNRCDPTRCAENVHYNIGAAGKFKQCDRKRGHGPEQAFCKQHDPAAAEARRLKSALDYEKKRLHDKRNQFRWSGGPALLDALQSIADGHNNPHELAAQVLANWHKEMNDPDAY